MDAHTELEDEFKESLEIGDRIMTELAQARADLERAEAALKIPIDEIGQIMHESWTQTKRTQGFHHPDEQGHGTTSHPCAKCHGDLVPWASLSERQKDINRHAFDAVLARIQLLAKKE